jgi:peptide/nickel transport system substrate-binding protein
LLKKISLFILLIMIFLSGCTGERVKTNEIVIAQGVDATTLDPHMHNETTSANVTAQIFDSLFVRAKDMNLEPCLAESIEMIDPLTWEIILKQGIRFHNGELFDAEAARFSIERIMDPNNTSPQLSGVSMIDKVEVLATNRIRVVTKNPYPLLPGRLTMAMVPPGYIEEVGVEAFAQYPVGTGAFVFEKWTKDEEIVMVANTEYFARKPALDKGCLPSHSRKLRSDCRVTERSGGSDQSCSTASDRYYCQ